VRGDGKAVTGAVDPQNIRVFVLLQLFHHYLAVHTCTDNA
jgi:hypothetical protein